MSSRSRFASIAVNCKCGLFLSGNIKGEILEDEDNEILGGITDELDILNC